MHSNLSIQLQARARAPRHFLLSKGHPMRSIYIHAGRLICLGRKQSEKCFMQKHWNVFEPHSLKPHSLQGNPLSTFDRWCDPCLHSNHPLLTKHCIRHVSPGKRRIVMVRLHTLSSRLPKYKGFARQYARARMFWFSSDVWGHINNSCNTSTKYSFYGHYLFA